VPALPSWVLVASVVLFVGALVAVWAPAVTPGLDTPLNLMMEWISAHPERYVGWFQSNFSIALLVHRAVLDVAFHLASPFVAIKLARTLEIASLGLGGLALVRRLDATPGVVVPLCLAGGFGWFHLMGYLNFTFAVALVPWALVCLRDRPARTDLFWLSLVLLLVTETHTFVGAALAAILLVSALCHRVIDRPGDTAQARGVALATAPAFAAVLMTVLIATANQPAFDHHSRRVTTLLQDLAALPQTAFGGYAPLGAPLAAVAVAASGAWLWSERRARTLRFWVGALSLASLAVYFVVPLDGFGWIFLKPRVAVFPLLVAAMPARLPVRWAKVASGAVIALVAAHLALFGVRSARAGRRTADIIASFGTEAPGVTLPIVFDGRDGEEPEGNLGAATYTYAYAVLNGGGAAPGLFAHNPAIHHVLYAKGVAARIPQQPNAWAYRWLSRAELVDAAAVSACRADSVAVIGASEEDRGLLEARGIRFDRAPGLGHPSCAQGTLHLARQAQPVRVRVGFAATDAWALDLKLDGEEATVDLALPAGDVDVLLCEVDRTSCRPGSSLAEGKLAVRAGGKFRTTIGPR
jgi:hypothetical protein